jgi:4-hydroxybenzoate polyprenyltransferase
LASGEVTPRQAVTIAIFLVAMAGILVFTLNALTILLSPIAVPLACVYPFAKRVLHVPQAVLGIAFGWGTIMAWAASRGAVEAPAWVLWFATLCWAVGYDTIYALQDQEDDRRIGVKSSVLFFGEWTWLAVTAVLAVMLISLGLAGWMAKIGWTYYVALGAVALFCVKQSVELRRPVTSSRAFQLFHQHVWLGAGILAGMIAGFVS